MHYKSRTCECLQLQETFIKIQQEMAIEGKSLSHTDVGSTIKAEVETRFAQKKEDMERLQDSLLTASPQDCLEIEEEVGEAAPALEKH